MLGVDVNPFGDEFPILETEFSVEGPSPTRDDQHPEDAEVLFTSAQRALFDAPLEPPLARPKVDLGDLRGQGPILPVPGEVRLRPRHR